MKITYGRFAYVKDVGDEMIDSIRNQIRWWADGEESVCVTREDFTSAMDDLNDSPNITEHESKLRDLINAINQKLEGEIVDIIFCS